MADGGAIQPRDDIPTNTCIFVLQGGVYVNDGCNCSPGFQAPPAPPVPSDPQSPIYVACVLAMRPASGQVS